MVPGAAARACIVRTAGGRRSPWRFPFIRDQIQPSVPGTGRARRRRRRGRNELTPAVARREEWREQVKLARLLDKWLDPACTFWTATDPVAASLTSGAMRKKRGVKPGVPDVLVWYPGGSITIELKSRHGQCSRSQRAVREALLRAGAQWWVCRSANAAMWALGKSGVPFRTIVYEDGTIERWQQPELSAFEVPKRNPHERRPRAPDWEPEAAAEIADLAAASDEVAGDDIAA
jgi:hypothetical protein